MITDFKASTSLRKIITFLLRFVTFLQETKGIETC